MASMDALLTSPAVIRTAAAAAGLTAARLEYHKGSDTLYLFVAAHGQIKSVPVPCGITYTRDEICALLTSDPADLTVAMDHGDVDPYGSAQPAAARSGDPPGSP
jgi:hypothetical protein